MFILLRHRSLGQINLVIFLRDHQFELAASTQMYLTNSHELNPFKTPKRITLLIPFVRIPQMSRYNFVLHLLCVEVIVCR